MILDTETSEYEAYQEVFAEYGTELPLALWSKAIGTRGGFDPHAHLERVAGLGARAGQTVAIEDSLNGALAAVRAGRLCVIIPNPVTAALTFPDGVAWRLNSMADMPLSELLLQLPDSFRAPLC